MLPSLFLIKIESFLINAFLASLLFSKSTVKHEQHSFVFVQMVGLIAFTTSCLNYWPLRTFSLSETGWIMFPVDTLLAISFILVTGTSEWKQFQEALIFPLLDDGIFGPCTKEVIKEIKFADFERRMQNRRFISSKDVLFCLSSQEFFFGSSCCFVKKINTKISLCSCCIKSRAKWLALAKA